MLHADAIVVKKLLKKKVKVKVKVKAKVKIKVISGLVVSANAVGFLAKGA